MRLGKTSPESPVTHLPKGTGTKSVCGQTLYGVESNPPGTNPTCQKCLSYARKRSWTR